MKNLVTLSFDYTFSFWNFGCFLLLILLTKFTVWLVLQLYYKWFSWIAPEWRKKNIWAYLLLWFFINWYSRYWCFLDLSRRLVTKYCLVFFDFVLLCLMWSFGSYGGNAVGYIRGCGVCGGLATSHLRRLCVWLVFCRGFYA